MATLLFVASLLTGQADELRMARFDAKRVFEQYQHAKDASAQHSKHDEPPSELDRLRDRRQSQKRQIDELTTAVAAATDTERDHLQSQLGNALVLVQITELQITIEMLRRDQALKEEFVSTRAQILQEIWRAAWQLSTEGHYQLVIPNDLSGDGLFIGVIASEQATDLTEPLLKRLNDQYAAKSFDHGPKPEPPVTPR